VNDKDRKSIQKAKTEFKSNKKIINNLKKRKTIDIDKIFHENHDSEFQKMDCLSCANCCKTTSPIFRDADIRRLSKHLKIKESKLIDDYLRIDEDQDYVLKQSPCIFLNNDNTCSVYEARPLACREYPHTDRKNMQQILDLTLRNSLICPVVARIFDYINLGQNSK
jgi:Fe-S-cluster containining protein